MRLLNWVAAAVAAVGLLSATAASAATIVGGNTRVAVNQTLLGAPFNIGPGVTGGTTVFQAPTGVLPLIVNIPVTGGDTAVGPINHDGSGVTLTRNGATITLANFVVNFGGTVTGSLTRSNGTTTTGETLFTFNPGSLGDIVAPANFLTPVVGLNISSTLSAVLLSDLSIGQLGLTDLTSVRFGNVASAPEVPLPAAAWMFLAGVGALAMRRKKQPAAA